MVMWILGLLDYCIPCWKSESKLQKLHYAFLRVDPTGNNKKFYRCTICKHYEWR